LGCRGWFKPYSHPYRKKGAAQTVRHFCATTGAAAGSQPAGPGVAKPAQIGHEAAERPVAIRANLRVKSLQNTAVR
jgi:hypothetical protein